MLVINCDLAADRSLSRLVSVDCLGRWALRWLGVISCWHAGFLDWWVKDVRKLSWLDSLHGPVHTRQVRTWRQDQKLEMGFGILKLDSHQFSPSQSVPQIVQLASEPANPSSPCQIATNPTQPNPPIHRIPILPLDDHSRLPISLHNPLGRRRRRRRTSSLRHCDYPPSGQALEAVRVGGAYSRSDWAHSNRRAPTSHSDGVIGNAHEIPRACDFTSLCGEIRLCRASGA